MNSSEKLRLCHANDFKFFLVHEGPGSKATFSGFISPMVQDVMKTFLYSIKNVSLEVYSNKDATIDGFDVCIERLQKNQSDLLLLLSNYPASIENVTQGLVIRHSAINFLSFYYNQKSTLTSQITESFKSFPPFLWCLIFVSLFTVWFLLTMRRVIREKFFNQFVKYLFIFRLHWVDTVSTRWTFQSVTNGRFRKRNKNYAPNILAHFLRVGQINCHPLFNRFLYFVLSLMSLVIVHIFITLTKTEMVVIPQPEIYWSLKELIASGALPLFYFGFNHEKYLKDAPEGSIESEFLHYLKAKLPNESNWFIVAGRAADIHSYLDDILDRKRVIFVDEIMIQPFLTAFCKLQSKDPEIILKFMKTKKLKTKSELPHFNIAKVRDENVRSPMKGLLFSSAISKELYSRTVTATRRIIEAGVSNKIQDYIDSFDVSKATVLKDVPERILRAKECLTATIFDKESTHEPLKIVNLTQFLLYSLFSISLAFAILLCEVTYTKVIFPK